jgi:hypothetical protein
MRAISSNRRLQPPVTIAENLVFDPHQLGDGLRFRQANFLQFLGGMLLMARFAVGDADKLHLVTGRPVQGRDAPRLHFAVIRVCTNHQNPQASLHATNLSVNSRSNKSTPMKLRHNPVGGSAPL